MAKAKFNYNDMRDMGNSQLADAFGLAASNAPVSSEIKMMPIDEITLDPKGEFQEIFPIDEDDLWRISDSMRKKGFYRNQHILYGKILEEDSEFVLDGHTRVAAARDAGIDSVPVYCVTFETRREAIMFCYEIQLNRRNLTDGQKLVALSKLDELKNPGRKSGEEVGTGKSAADMAEQLGMSERKVEQGRAILNSGDEEIIDAVKNDKMSYDAAYKAVKKSAKPKAKAKPPAYGDDMGTPLPDEGEDFSSDLGGGFVPEIQLGKESRYEEDEALRREAHGKGYDEGLLRGSEIAYDIFCFALAEVYKGRSVKEVFNDERVSDFTPFIIKNFVLPEDDEKIISSL